jgi:hypothetical protein
MFNGLIDSTEVWALRGSSFRSSGGSTRSRLMEQDIMNERMEQWLRENEEYNLQMQEYYSQRKEQWDTTFAQQQLGLQVSMSCKQLASRALNTLYY